MSRGKIDPVGDAETVETELMLADLDSLERRATPIEKKAKSGEKEAKEAFALMTKALVLLREGKPARLAELTPEERTPYSQLGLMTAKPVLYVCNVDEGSAAKGNKYSNAVEEMAKRQGAGCVVISARIEEEVAQLAAAERAEFLSSLDLEEPGLNRLIRAGYNLLGLITFFTAGPKEGARLDGGEGLARAAGRGRHPHRFREGLHSAPRPSPMTNISPTTARPAPATPASSARRQGLRRAGRRRDAFQVCELETSCHSRPRDAVGVARGREPRWKEQDRSSTWVPFPRTALTRDARRG